MRVFSCDFYKIFKNTFFTKHLRTTAAESGGKQIWDKVFKNGPSKIFERQPLKNLKGYSLRRHVKQERKAMRKSHCINKCLSRSFLIILYFLRLSIFFPGYMHLLRSLSECPVKYLRWSLL